MKNQHGAPAEPAAALAAGRVFFVSRHEGARHWARIQTRLGQLAPAITDYVDELDPEQVRPGDTVMGTLPVHLAAQVCARGGRFVSLDLQLPPAMRGRELSATEMQHCRASLIRYDVRPVQPHMIDGWAVTVPTRGPEASAWLMLASGELAPNFIAWAMLRTPKVYVVATAKMRSSKAETLRQTLQSAGCASVEIVDFDDQGSLKDQEAQARQHIAALLQACQGGVIHVNVSGGTKVMAWAFMQAAERLGWSGRVYAHYVDSEHQRIENLTNGQAQPQRSALGLRELLALRELHASRVESQDAKWRRRALDTADLQRWLLHAGGSVLTPLNKMAAIWQELLKKLPDMGPARIDAAKDKRFRNKSWAGYRLDRNDRDELTCHAPWGAGDEALREALAGELGRLLVAGRVAKRLPACTDNGVSVVFSGPWGLRNLAGKWLESWIGAAILAARPDDWGCGVAIAQDKGPDNDIDGLLLCGNQVLIIEAKTTKVTGSGDRHQKSADTTYKLDSVAGRVASQFRERIYASVLPVSPEEVKRSAGHEITVFAGMHPMPGVRPISELPNYLAQWVAERRLEWVDGYQASGAALKAATSRGARRH